MLISWDLTDGFHVQLAVKVSVDLSADSLEKRGETHIVQKLQIKPHAMSPSQLALCSPLTAFTHYMGAIPREQASLWCYKGSESLSR